jgi:tRNA dimethylallyltransferase
MPAHTKPLITILGPTASGKTRLGVAMARLFQGEIISADSRQVYRYMDIGTGKDLAEYGEIPYHLIDVIHPDQEYSLFHFAQDFIKAIKTIHGRNHLPLLVGGTGMYLDAALSRYKLTIANIDKKTRDSLEKKTDDALRSLLAKLKPGLHNTTDTENRDRLLRAIEIAMTEQSAATGDADQVIIWPDYQTLILGIKMERTQLKQRIQNRLKARFKEGMIDEVEMLIRKGVSLERLYHFGLEYRYIAQYLSNELNYNDMQQKLNSEIVRFAKQQEKWFRNLQKKQHQIAWLEADESMEDKAKGIITRFLSETIKTPGC